MSYIGVQPTQTAFVTDLFNGTGSATAFTMSVSPASTASILVTVSGVLQSPDTYSISGQTLNFSAAPPSGTGNISVRYLGIPASGVTTTAYRTVTEFTATAGQTTFSVPSYTVGYIDVYRNGARLGTADYTASNGTSVVLVNGASSGDLITTESFYVSSVVNAIPAVAGAVNSNYIANDVTINFADGSASTPSITNNGNTNTGIFFPAADTIAFTEGGTESMRIDSSGRLLINTTTARTTLTGDRSALVQIEGQSVDQFLSIIRNENNAFGSAVWLGKSRGTTAGSNTTVQAGDSLGSLVFLGANGTNTQQAASIFVEATGTISASAMPGNMIFTTTGAGSNTPTERMRITSGGDLLVGTTNSSLTAGQGFKAIYNSGTDPYVGAVMASSSNSQTNYHLYSTGAGTFRFYVGMGGTISATSATITTISDQRLKENIVDIDVGLDAVMALKPRKFDWKAGKGKDKKGDRGWIAQEFETVFPEMIQTWKDPAPEGEEPYKAVNADLIPVLVKAIQELNAKVEAQAAEIAALKGAIE